MCVQGIWIFLGKVRTIPHRVKEGSIISSVFQTINRMPIPIINWGKGMVRMNGISFRFLSEFYEPCPGNWMFCRLFLMDFPSGPHDATKQISQRGLMLGKYCEEYPVKIKWQNYLLSRAKKILKMPLLPLTLFWKVRLFYLY